MLVAALAKSLGTYDGFDAVLDGGVLRLHELAAADALTAKQAAVLLWALAKLGFQSEAVEELVQALCGIIVAAVWHPPSFAMPCLVTAACTHNIFRRGCLSLSVSLSLVCLQTDTFTVQAAPDLEPRTPVATSCAAAEEQALVQPPDLSWLPAPASGAADEAEVLVAGKVMWAGCSGEAMQRAGAASVAAVATGVFEEDALAAWNGTAVGSANTPASEAAGAAAAGRQSPSTWPTEPVASEGSSSRSCAAEHSRVRGSANEAAASAASVWEQADEQVQVQQRAAPLGRRRLPARDSDSGSAFVGMHSQRTLSITAWALTVLEVEGLDNVAEALTSCAALFCRIPAASVHPQVLPTHLQPALLPLTVCRQAFVCACQCCLCSSATYTWLAGISCSLLRDAMDALLAGCLKPGMGMRAAQSGSALYHRACEFNCATHARPQSTDPPARVQHRQRHGPTAVPRPSNAVRSLRVDCCPRGHLLFAGAFECSLDNSASASAAPRADRSCNQRR